MQHTEQQIKAEQGKLSAKLEKQAAIDWLKTQTDNFESTEVKPPSIRLRLSSDETERKKQQNHLAALQKTVEKRRLRITEGPDNTVMFVGEESLFYLTRKGVIFPDSETYKARFELGKQFLEIAHDHSLTEEQKAEACKALLKQGAWPRTRNDEGEHAIHYFALDGALLPARILLEAGANPNASTNDGSMPLNYTLHGAAVAASHPEAKKKPQDYVDMGKLLIEFGAKPDKQVDGHISPYEDAVARAKDHAVFQPLKAQFGEAILANKGPASAGFAKSNG